MSVARDFKTILDGDFLGFLDVIDRSTILPPNQGLSITFSAQEGPDLLPPIKLHVMSLDHANPMDAQVVGGHLDPRAPDNSGYGSLRTTYHNVPLRVQLFAPQRADAVATWTTVSGDSTEPGNEYSQLIGGSNPAGGIWRCVVTNISNRMARCTVTIDHIKYRYRLKQTDIPQRVLCHAFSSVLEALTPSARLSGSTATVSFGSELRSYLGDLSETPLGSQRFTLPAGLEGTGELLGVEFFATSGQRLLDFMRDVWQQRKTTLENSLSHIPAPSPSERHRLQSQLTANNDWKSEWEQKVAPNDPTIHARVAVSDISVSGEVLFWGVDVAEINDVFVDVFIAFDSLLARADVLVRSPATFTGGIADLAEYFGLIPEAGELLEAFLAPAIERVSVDLGRYLGEVLVRLAAGRRLFFRLEAVGDDAWRVSHCNVPSDQPQASDLPDTSSELAPFSSLDGGGGGGGRAAELGAIPAEFVINDPETLDRLDQVETIVVLMMENRSFDHMFGFLRQTRGEQYEGLRLDGSESNPPPTDFTNNFVMRKASDVVAGNVTRIPVSPHHEFDHVVAQINDGAMDGFVSDMRTRTENPQLAMTYYTHTELPVYYQLASEFSVCDNWFCAHPGPTWPNRWSTLAGQIPEVDNFDVDDPRLGFFPQMTIFDMLRLYDIPCRYFESDVSMLRMFDRYRIDDHFIVPIDDPEQGFGALAARGELPPVVFIDPNFVDIPPVSTANDDHAPADLADGQDFIARIYNTLVTSPQWNRTMFVITYDEHGGFYDHVPPPGTSPGAADWLGNVAKIHPDGAGFMGPRVPTMIISPWVGSGVVSKTVFDHTSILKTILVRHRDKIQGHHLTRFGPRVNQISHMGAALDQTVARNSVPDPIARHIPGHRPTRPTDGGDRVVPTNSDGTSVTPAPSVTIARRSRRVRPIVSRTSLARTAAATPVEPPSAASLAAHGSISSGAANIARRLVKANAVVVDADRRIRQLTRIVDGMGAAIVADLTVAPVASGGESADSRRDFALSLKRALLPKRG